MSAWGWRFHPNADNMTTLVKVPLLLSLFWYFSWASGCSFFCHYKLPINQLTASHSTAAALLTFTLLSIHPDFIKTIISNVFPLKASNHDMWQQLQLAFFCMFSIFPPSFWAPMLILRSAPVPLSAGSNIYSSPLPPNLPIHQGLLLACRTSQQLNPPVILVAIFYTTAFVTE